MAKVVVTDFLGKSDGNEPNEFVIPEAALCKIVIKHDDGSETLLFVGNKYEQTACLCPNNRCADKRNFRLSLREPLKKAVEKR